MTDRLLTPQQENFLKYYTDPTSDTYSNALQSALKAGYQQEYAENITHLMPDWLSDALGTTKRLKKAEKRLDQILDLEPVDEQGRVDNSLIANQMKAINLIAKGIGKSIYSERQEHTGPNGQELKVTGFNFVRNDTLDTSNEETGGSMG